MACKAKATLAGAAVLLLGAGAAHAQSGDAAIAGEMRECRQLRDEAARIACYDTIPVGQDQGRGQGQGQGQGQPAGSPAASPAASPAPAPPPPAARAPAGFGAGQLPRPATSTPAEPDRITAQVAVAIEREPGIWLLTLEDGAQWAFVDSVPPSYDPPRRGKAVELLGTALGGYLMRYAGQRGIRVHRVR